MYSVISVIKVYQRDMKRTQTFYGGNSLSI